MLIPTSCPASLASSQTAVTGSETQYPDARGQYVNIRIGRLSQRDISRPPKIQTSTFCGLHAFTGKLDQLSTYKSRGFVVDVSIGIHTSAGHGGPRLRADVLAALAALGFEVSLDLYPDT
jgi:hypothetical protein